MDILLIRTCTVQSINGSIPLSTVSYSCRVTAYTVVNKAILTVHLGAFDAF